MTAFWEWLASGPVLGTSGLLAGVGALIVTLRKVGPQARQLRIANEQQVTAMYDRWSEKQDARYDELEADSRQRDQEWAAKYRALEGRLNALADLLEVHAEWDRDVVAKAREVQLVLPPAPPLRIPA